MFRLVGWLVGWLMFLLFLLFFISRALLDRLVYASWADRRRIEDVVSAPGPCETGRGITGTVCEFRRGCWMLRGYGMLVWWGKGSLGSVRSARASDVS